jgi:hypothetical protein
LFKHPLSVASMSINVSAEVWSLFRSMPVETAPPPDEGDIGATPFQDLLANMEDPLANEGEEFNG